MVDGMFTSEEKPVLATYMNAYRDLQAVESEMEALGPDARGLERELEMTRFQIAEIDEAGFVDGDEESLRLRLDRLRYAEEITEELSVAMGALGESGIEDVMGRALGALDKVARIDTGAASLSARLSEVAGEASELARDLSRYAATIDRDPSALAADEQRISELSALKRKYGDTISDISAFAKVALERSETIVELLDAAQSLTARHAQAITAIDAASLELRSLRAEHAFRASQSAQTHLRDLGFDNPAIRITVEPKEPTSTGADRFRILFASDAALTPAPMSSIASGGELSRLVLALTLASGGADAELVAFDEIDAGIGGSTALAMGEKLAALARTRQVICVTHLPQVAAYGSRHYSVERNGTTASIEEVDGPRRVEEISRMLAGMGASEKGKSHAKELLAAAAGSSMAKE
jgi:DNA repair protein RecN (Recombination protein N)